MALPKCMADKNREWSGLSEVVRAETASENRLPTQQGKEVLSNVRFVDWLWVAAFVKHRSATVDPRYEVNGVCALFPIEEVGLWNSG